MARLNENILPIFETDSNYTRSILLVKKEDKYTDETPAVRIEVGYTEDPSVTIHASDKTQLGHYLKHGSGEYQPIEDSIYAEHVRNEVYLMATEEEINQINVFLGKETE